jgi:hypothetical protein
MWEAARRLGRNSPAAAAQLLERTGPHRATQVCGCGLACMVRVDYLAELAEGLAAPRAARRGRRAGRLE